MADKQIFVIAGPNGAGKTTFAMRHLQGEVPEDVVRRRFDAGLRNLREHYMGRVDEWMLLDNSGPVPVFIEQGTNRD